MNLGTSGLTCSKL